MTQLQCRSLSSLTKVFPDQNLAEPAYRRATALHGEVYAFQVAYRAERLVKGIQVRADSLLQGSISIRSVGVVPSELPCYDDPDENVLRTTPGLYPDPLLPIRRDGLTAFPSQWRAVWISVRVADSVPGGLYPIDIVFEKEDGERLGSERFELEVIPAALPKQRLIHTEWLHADCLATHYRVDVFDEAHWALIERYMQTASEHGINMILTPLFTPPLDTEIGGERPTVQLVDVEKEGDAYRFRFDKLARWVEMAERNGIEFFEFSHLFTQWGARHAPKIIATENGKVRRIFGWETDASGEAYRGFLSQLIPCLLDFIESHGLRHRSYFHVSDEPTLDHLESYRAASDFLRPLLQGYPVIDALSDYRFYQEGLVPRPVPANSHIEPFLEHGVPDLWTYYCCVQYHGVSNRFFAFPSARNRIIGLQMYKFGIAGFLHWGYNFWYTQFSREAIDPYRNTDAGYAFASGDSFLVYPGEDGPVESIRLEVFHEALQDMRALELLECLIGKVEAVKLLEAELAAPLTFGYCPGDAGWLLRTRETINRKIAEHVKA